MNNRWSWGILVGVLLLSVVTIWLRLGIIRRTYEANQLDQTARNITHEMESLKVQLARAKSPNHLEVLARKWGFSQPKPDQRVVLEVHP